MYIHHRLNVFSSSFFYSIPFPLRFVPSSIHFRPHLSFIHDFVSKTCIDIYIIGLDLFLLLLLSLPFLSLFPSFVPSSIHFIRGFKLEKIYIYIYTSSFFFFFLELRSFPSSIHFLPYSFWTCKSQISFPFKVPSSIHSLPYLSFTRFKLGKIHTRIVTFVSSSSSFTR